MQTWQKLSEVENIRVWNLFYTNFNFHPGMKPDQWPSITEPQPSITYSIATAFNNGTQNYLIAEADLNLKTLQAFQKCTALEDSLFALDWQHDCYNFYPHLNFDFDNADAWLVPVLPNGDYYIFLSKDASFGLFGQPWEQTICVFGQPLLDAFEVDKPVLFQDVVRAN